MINRFCLVNCRFHIRKENTIILQGYYEKRLVDDNRPIISLDYHRLDYERTVRHIPGRDGKMFYFFVVPLPTNYREYKRLRCFQYQGEDILEAFHLNTGWIGSLENKEDFYIDSAEISDGEILVRGWMPYHRDTKVYLSRRKYPSGECLGRARQVEREDVLRACPDFLPEDVYGFEIKGCCHWRKLWCIVEKDGKISTHKIDVKRKKHVSLRRSLSTLIRKTAVYYQQFGLMATVSRAAVKLSGKEIISYKTWQKNHTPSKRELDRQKKTRFAYEPSYAVVVPLYKTPGKFLSEMIRSVEVQTYEKWHLYLSDGSGSPSPIADELADYEEREQRITVLRGERAMKIVENTNRALKVVSEDYVVFMDHDDTIPPETLYELTRELQKFPLPEIIYSDEDKMDIEGKRYFDPHFKPNFNMDLLRSANYLSHLFVVKRETLEEVGYLREAYEGSQDYDLALRCIEKTDRISHIPQVLYHWRAHPESTAGNPESKEYAYEAAQRAIKAHIERCGQRGEVIRLGNGFYRIKYALEEEPLVSLIIPNCDHLEDLKRCVDSFYEKNTYGSTELIIVENHSKEKNTFRYYDDLKSTYDNLRVIQWNKAFNYSAINNMAVKKARGEYVLLLNNDTEFIDGELIREMMSFAIRRDVGVVGARLFYPQGTVQHAGVIIGLGGVAGHAFKDLDKGSVGYFFRVCCAQEYSAVTGACMMVKREIYEKVGGMEEDLAVAFNDVDFCLKVRKRGYKVIYAPFAMLNHAESSTRGPEDTREKQERFQKEIDIFLSRWSDYVDRGDPFYNPHLTLDKPDFSLGLH